MPKRSHRWARWGLLLTTLTLGGLLIAAVITGHLAAQEASQAVIRARALGLLVTVRRTLRLSWDDPRAAMQDLVSDSHDERVRYVALLDPSGREVLSAGKRKEKINKLPSFRVRRTPLIRSIGNRVRVIAPFARRRRPPWRRARRWLPKRREQLRRLFGSRIVLEFRPEMAQSLTGSAKGALLAGLVAAGALLVAAAFFWRLSRRADRIERDLAKERQLAALGEMSAVLGHELRNPLASLKGHAQLLLEKLPQDHVARRGAETVVREAVRLEEMTVHILDFARSGSIERRAEDPTAVARAAAEAVDPNQIQVFAADAPPRWLFDRVRIEQVLVNLLRNAKQASPSNEPVDLTVREETGRLLFTIRDRGPGVDEEDAKRIFEPFYTNRVKGTGLGLTVAKRIVEGHGGTLEVTTPLDGQGGALFRLALPARLIIGS